MSVLSDTSIDEALTTRDNAEVYIEVVLDPELDSAERQLVRQRCGKETMKVPCSTSAAPLAHLTAVHLLGRILERLDHNDGATGRTRYQLAMRHLTEALDRVEHTFVVRQMLEANPAPANNALVPE